MHNKRKICNPWPRAVKYVFSPWCLPRRNLINLNLDNESGRVQLQQCVVKYLQGTKVPLPINSVRTRSFPQVATQKRASCLLHLVSWPFDSVALCLSLSRLSNRDSPCLHVARTYNLNEWIEIERARAELSVSPPPLFFSPRLTIPYTVLHRKGGKRQSPRDRQTDLRSERE